MICKLFLKLLSIIMVVGFIILPNEPDEMDYNLLVVNNSNESIKSIGYYQENDSGGIQNADDSLIKPGEELYLILNNESFKVSVIDSEGNEFISDEFDVDLDSSKGENICKISIEKDEEFKFVLK